MWAVLLQPFAHILLRPQHHWLDQAAQRGAGVVNAIVVTATDLRGVGGKGVSGIQPCKEKNGDGGDAGWLHRIVVMLADFGFTLSGVSGLILKSEEAGRVGMGCQAGCLAVYRPNTLNFPALLLQTGDPAPFPYASPSPTEHYKAQEMSWGVLRVPPSPGRDGHLLAALSGDEASEVLEDSGKWCKAIPTRSPQESNQQPAAALEWEGLSLFLPLSAFNPELTGHNKVP